MNGYYLKKFGFIILSIAHISQRRIIEVITFFIMTIASVFDSELMPNDAHFIQAIIIIMKDTSRVTVTKILVNALIISGNELAVPLSLSHTKHCHRNGIEVFNGTHFAPVPFTQNLQSQYCCERHCTVIHL